MKKVTINNLKIEENLIKFINDEAIPGTDIPKEKFWKGLRYISNSNQMFPLL